jgi:hypothetical protein
MVKTGNLFEVARQQLTEEFKKGNVPLFDDLDVFDRAVQLRYRLDGIEEEKNRMRCKKNYLRKRG